MKTKTSSSGFSLVKLIIILAILAILGVGGYFGYKTVIEPTLNPTAKIIPASLQTYAIGKDADVFILYKKDQDVEDEIKNLPTPAAIANDVQNAIILFKVDQDTTENAFAAIEFISTEKAQSAKTILEGFSSKQPPTFELQDKILLISLGKDKNAFIGLLSENPNFIKIDKETANSQLIAYINNSNVAQVDQLMTTVLNSLPASSFINKQATLNRAHAQGSGFISASDNPPRIADPAETKKQQTILAANKFSLFFKETIFYLKIKEGILSSKTTYNIIPKEEISSTVIGKMTANKIPTTDLEKVYNDSYKELQEIIPNINSALNRSTKDIPKLNTNLTLDSSKLTFELSIPLNDLNSFLIMLYRPITLNAPMRARNASRKADINNIKYAIETYNINNDKYPQKSGCLEDLPDLNEFFSENKSPKDFSGTQSFGTINCSSGYYYQFIPKNDKTQADGYIVWSKMEKSEGNTTETPDTILTKIYDQSFLDTLKSTRDKEYYISTEIELIEQPQTTSASTSTIDQQNNGNPSITPVKIRRKP